MEIQITTDKYHESNHTTCAESFKSSEYYDLYNSNTQAFEQTNNKLLSIATLCAFMNPECYDLDNSNHYGEPLPRISVGVRSTVAPMGPIGAGPIPPIWFGLAFLRTRLPCNDPTTDDKNSRVELAVGT